MGILQLRYYRGTLNFTVVFLLLIFSLNSKSQTILFTEGFEGNFPPTDWSVQNYTQGSNGWNQYSFDKHSGNYSAACFPNILNSNAWIFTNALNLQAGKYYVLSYYIKTEGNTSLKITLNTSPDYGGQFKTIRNTFPAPSGSFALVNDTIVCEISNTYYIGINNFSSTFTGSSSLIDDITFTDLNFPNCGTVSAGTVSSSASSVCAGSSFTLTCNNATTNIFGIRYAWQKSTDGVNWSNITNGYQLQRTIQVTQSVSTYYRMTDTCNSTSNSAISNQIQVTNSSYLTCYCVPAVTNCSNFSFSNVTIFNSSINNTTGCSANGYGDYTSIGSATVYRNQNIYIQHTVNNTFSFTYSVGIWVDINHSGTFDANEFVTNSPLTTSTGTSQFLIPASALTGETRLRLSIKYFNSPGQEMTFLEACNPSAFTGETEDYKIIIIDAPNCTGTVSAGTISAVSAICPNNNFTITATNATVYQDQMRYAWQQSADNTNWSTITNTSYLINPLTVSANSSTFYRLTDTCLASSQSAVSNSISVTVNNIFTCYCAPASSNCSTFGIDSVSFNTIHNGSTCSAGGYANYSGISTTINNGTNNSIYIKFKATTNLKYAIVWIDFNRNGTFENSERVFYGVTTLNFITGIINVPFNVSGGETGMRVMVLNSSLYTNPCTTGSGFGETEDYKVVLNLASPVTNKFCYYIKKTATGLNDGTNWANAFTSMVTAFSYARTGDSLKVAKGLYEPGTSNTNSFSLKDSLNILGGYPDTGNPTDADRNFSTHQTVMSGEIGTPANTDNVKVILQGSNVKGFVVDGFVIEKGYDGNTSTNGPVYFTNATGILKNTVIRNNYNASNGCAVSMQNATINLINNFIENNNSDGFNSTASVLNVSARSVVSLVNNVIAKNTARNIINLHNSSVSILNATVFKNYGFVHVHDTSNLAVQNSIFYYNGNNFYLDTAEIQKDVYSSVIFNNNITEVYNYASNGFIGLNPKFTDTLNIAGADNKYFTNDDGLRIMNPCSPAINAGNNVFVVNVNSDISGNGRIKNGVVDLGAYEVQEPIATQPAVLYVNRTATGQNNGLSWQDAFTDLQSAFYRCSDSIKVAKGTYPVSSTNDKAYYQLSNNRVVMGGFPNTGSPTNNDFDPVLNPTIIDGTVNASEKSRKIIVSINNNNSSRFIGFEIVNSALPDFNYNTNTGTIKVAYNSSPYFDQIKMDCAKAWAFNLILVKANSNPQFYKSRFYNIFSNQSNIYEPRGINISKNSNPTFLKCYFGKDTSVSSSGVLGAGFTINNSGTIIDSCTFFKAANDAIFSTNSSPLIQNSSFTKTTGRSITNNASSMQVKNCVFNDTSVYANQNGGTIGNYNNSTPVFSKCRFNNSYSAYSGGVCYNENSNVVFKSCVFNNSYASSSGGAILSDGSQLKLVNCIAYNFNHNTNNGNSNGSFLSSSGNSSSIIANCTIVGHTTNLKPVISCFGSSTVKLYNSIIWRYGFHALNMTADNDIYTSNNNNAAICDIRNSMLYKQQNTLLTNSVVGINPKLTDLSAPNGSDGTIYSNDDGYMPCTCSRALNTGDNSLNTEGSDILEASRIFNGTIDIGAYELQASPTSANTFYVKQNAAASGDGLSWANAYNGLQKAVLNNCADTIKVATGTYKPASTARDSSFNIYSGITMYGGYPATGNPGNADRNPNLYPTILSGDLGVANDSTDNSLSVVKVHCPDTTVILDGLIIERGNANVSASGGGGVQSIGNRHLIINNCIIRNNYGQAGGGIFSYYANLSVSKTVITNNNSEAGYYGGGFYIQDYYTPVNGNAWSPFIRFKNSVISNNNAIGGVVAGTGVMVAADTMRFENVVFYKNEGAGGGGLSMTDNPYVKIVNCDFIKNNVTTVTPGVAIRVSNPYNYGYLNTYVFNTIFKDNTVLGQPGTLLNNEFNWQNGNTQQETIPFQNLDYSAISGSQTGSGFGNIPSSGVTFLDIDNGKGNDNTWMTTDDGLQVTTCATSIDKGGNLHVQNIPKDILDSARIKNLRVDMGAYEGNSFTVKIVASDTAICPGTLVTFTATVQNGGTSPVYQWLLNGANVGANSNIYSSSTLNNNDQVRVKVKNQNCTINDTAYSNIITMRVGTSLTPVATITASDTTICAGGSVTFTATATGSNNNTVYQWQVNGVNTGTNSPTFTANNLSNNDVVRAVITINNPCLNVQTVTSNSIIIHVNPILTPSVSITSSANPVCSGSLITYTATPVNGGASPLYQWKVNGINAGTNSPIFSSSTIQNNDIITVVMTSSAACAATSTATSNAIVQQVSSPSQPSVTISSTPITCPGIMITFTATPVNGGASPMYQWKLNGTNSGTQSNTYSSNTLNENDIIVVTLTSSAACINSPTATSQPFVVHFSSAITPSVTISSSATSICAGTPVTFTATPVNGGANPTYQWFINNVNTGNTNQVFTTSTLNNNDQVKVVMTSSASCTTTPTATSNTIVMSVSPSVTPAVSISASSTTICTGTPVTFTATPVNGGTAPVYQWQVNGVNAGTNSNTFTSSTLANGDQVKVILTSNAACASPATATSNIVIITVSATIIPSVIISASSTTICSGASVTFTAIPTNGGANPSYQWQVNGVNAGTNSNTFTSSTLANGDQVKVILTSNAACASPVTATSNIVTITVSATVIPSVSISASSTTICSGASVTFTAISTNGGANPSYQWQVNGVNAGTNSNTFTSSTLANGNQVKVILTSNAACASPATATSNIVTMTVNATVTPVVSITASSTTICSGTSLTFTAIPTNGGSNPSYQWQVNGVNTGTNSNTFTSSTLANGDLVKVILTSNAACATPATATSNILTMTVNNSVTPAITIAGNTVVVTGQSSSLSASPNNGGTTPAYQWQDSTILHTWQNIVGGAAPALNYTPIQTGDKVRCLLISNANCANPTSATSNVLTFTVNTVTAINPDPASNFGIRYYPNPVNTVLFIDSLKLSDKWQTLEIKSMDGKSVIPVISIVNRTTTLVNVDRLPGGLYMAVLRRKNGIPAYLKFVRQ